MSQCLSLRISRIVPRSTLKKEIEKLGYIHVETNYFKYFEAKDFLSFSGVELELIFDKQKNRTEIRTRTAGLRNIYDFQYQNLTIKKLKKIFGGYVIDPDSQTRGYISINGEKELSVLERACGLAYHRYYGGIMKGVMMVGKLNIPEYMPYISEFHHDTNLGNIMIPFFVSIFEDFMRTFFSRYITYGITNVDINKKIDKKFSFDEIKQMTNGDIAFGEIIANNLSFQNLEVLKKSYKEFIGIDIQQVRNKTVKSRSDNQYNLYDELQVIIKKRHEIIHEAKFIYITKEKLEDYVDIFDNIGKEFIKYFEDSGLTLDLNSL